MPNQMPEPVGRPSVWSRVIPSFARKLHKDCRPNVQLRFIHILSDLPRPARLLARLALLEVSFGYCNRVPQSTSSGSLHLEHLYTSHHSSIPPPLTWV